MDELQERRGPGRPPNARPVPQNEPQSDAPRQRPSRKPFGSLEQKLAYEQRPGFHRHWFNDTGNRIARAQEAGYEHVKDNEGKNVSKLVGTAEGGGPLVGVLMEIPQEWYDEDMKMQQAQIDAKEDMIRKGQLESKQGDGRYIPSQGISIKHGQ
jgi:hypothetical protein